MAHCTRTCHFQVNNKPHVSSTHVSPQTPNTHYDATTSQFLAAITALSRYELYIYIKMDSSIITAHFLTRGEKDCVDFYTVGLRINTP